MFRRRKPRACTDSRTAIAFMRTWDTQIDAARWPVRVLTVLLMLFAGGSLLIAGIVQYAVVSFDMRRRVREVGLRMALGASARQVLQAVLREAFALTIAGLIAGFALSLAVGRVLGGALYGITPMTNVYGITRNAVSVFSAPAVCSMT